jgi:2-dehydro-3-deoxygluconokinase
MAASAAPEKKPVSGLFALGEVLLRITPAPQELWLQSPTAGLRVGGAEANVLCALAQWQHNVRLISALPAHALADAVLRELRGFGLDTSYIQRRSGRLGSYYLDSGALYRAPQVIYDREASAFSSVSKHDVNFAVLFQGALHLHVSGITPALGQNSFELTLAAMQAARAQGMTVSFDCNYRKALWQRWQSDAAAALRILLSLCDIVFAEARDLALCFSEVPPDVAPETLFDWTSALAFAELPNCRLIAHTARKLEQVDLQHVQSFLAHRGARASSAGPHSLHAIVDRIGTGDAFVAGVLHGFIKGWSAQTTLAYAHAAFLLKHGVLGDVLRATEDEVLALVEGHGLHVRR